MKTKDQAVPWTPNQPTPSERSASPEIIYTTTDFGRILLILFLVMIAAAGTFVVVLVGLWLLDANTLPLKLRLAIGFSLIPITMFVTVILVKLWPIAEATLEKIIGRDLNHSGVIGDLPHPTPAPRVEKKVVRLEVTNNKTVYFLDFPMESKRLVTLARLALANRLTERALTGLLAPPEWEELRGRLLEAGYLVWKNPEEHRSGLLITPRGKALFQELLAKSNEL